MAQKLLVITPTMASKYFIMKKVVYKEGDIFLISLGDKIFTGLIVKRKEKSKILLGYFWPIQINTGNDFLNTVLSIPPILIRQFSGLGFDLGRWKVIGRLLEWDSNNWPVPEFKKKDFFTNNYYAVQYDDDLEFMNERLITFKEASHLFEDGLSGFEALETRLLSL
ncbi:Imm26 family immunity protein [Runella rosea]|nr:Imm26 family immunity protein [Runella rosea]